jgi:polysaccharide export outer membrane protein
MFRVTDSTTLKQQIQSAEANYVIQKNDLLSLEVFTNMGEKIIDPNQESFSQTGERNTVSTAPTYLVDVSGVVKFPMVSEIKLEGLNIKQAEEILQKEYARFYQQPFIRIKFTNKRVVVLGAPGGQVIPLTNENIRLTEILAMAKGIGNDAKAHNIRILRNENVFISDLSTFDGYLKNNIIMMPGDIVYVEPVRRSFSEGLKEYGPVISIITSVGTLVIVVLQLNK